MSRTASVNFASTNRTKLQRFGDYEKSIAFEKKRQNLSDLNAMIVVDIDSVPAGSNRIRFHVVKLFSNPF